MINNNDIYQLTQLAEASYADFWLSGAEKVVTPDMVLGRLERLSPKIKGDQATSITSQWSVASHQKNTENGFSATLFHAKDSNNPDQYVLAFRGTETGLTTVYDDLADADLLDIVRDGLAMDQIVDMYNYWQQLKAPKGSAYQVAILETDYTLTAAYAAAIAGGPLAVLAYREYLQSRTDIVIDEPLGKVRKINFNYQSNQVFNDERSAGLGINPSSVTVVGHSLGGHLAAAFSRLFPNDVTEALMINGAGFGDGLAIGAGGNGPTNVDHLFSLLGGASSFNPDIITNLIGSAGWDFVAQDWWIGLHQPGATQHIQTETMKGNAGGHGSSQMTDAMAVYDLFLRLDKGLANKSLGNSMAWLEPIFKAISNTADYTFESLVNTLNKLLVSSSSAPIAKNNREALYSNIKNIRKSIDTIPSSAVITVDPLPIYPASTIINMAKGIDLNTNDSFAYRYALKELNPFAIRGLDYSNANKNGELDLLNLTTDKGSLSDSWIADRAAMLTWVMKANSADTQSVSGGSELEGRSWYFQDLATRKNLLAYPSGSIITTAKVSHVIFGSESSDVMAGDSYTDHFYGAGGNDTLYGANGDDYLEGGTGNDKLYGGNNNDQLYGNSGDDTLVGGDGDDVVLADNYAEASERVVA